ncbi:hypothetical protein HRI_001567200 [Hibiscus trionum]|uniref:Reverse transcriptase domain-containing protein n=1 Tax=Hibiscus trionum TaxID=183268 RepID=A0A9W7LVR1_HIBTR|nr:hypothetical protein HRI_001567200 [Hibiscus trionum]
MGFGSKWQNWIRKCICSTSISVLINGSSTKSFRISRGLRQGCPLSPLLFNIVAEGLSSFLKKATSRGFFNGVSIGDSDVKISHLQFADDLVVFCENSEMKIRNVIRILRGFGIASGLRMNLLKTKQIGINVEQEVLENWAVSIPCKVEKLQSQYLGLPLGSYKNSMALWTPIIEKFKKHLAGWNSKLLSLGGRITLVKYVLSCIPIFFMSIFSMPAAVASTLNSSIANFIWGALDKRSIHWLSWETLCKPKNQGGLGLCDLRVKNRALLNK